MRAKVSAATVVAVAALVLAGCSVGPGGGLGGGGMQPVTAVNLNTNGVSPGGANTAEVVTATNAFLATLDPTKRDRVEYAFTDNEARQTWSNFPAMAVPREGIVLSDLDATQQAALALLLRVALSPDGAAQNANIQKADDYLSNLGGQGAEGFGALNDYYVAVYGTPSATEPFMVQFGGHHGLFLAFAVVLLVPATRSYFGLTAPDPPVVEYPAIGLVLWFVTLSPVLRYRVLERVLGLKVTEHT